MLSGSRRHTHVPAGATVVDGITAHQLPPCFHTLDCGFSPVLAEIGMFGYVVPLGGALCTEAVPSSVNVCPAIGRNFQSYELACSVSFNTPNALPVWTSLVGRRLKLVCSDAPPVPTVNWRMP